jgi:hypothetical protein
VEDSKIRRILTLIEDSFSEVDTRFAGGLKCLCPFFLCQEVFLRKYCRISSETNGSFSIGTAIKLSL